MTRTSALRFGSTRARRLAAIAISAGVGVGVTFGAGVSNAAATSGKIKTLHFSPRLPRSAT